MLNRVAWDFSTEPEFELELDLTRTFVKEAVAPLDLVFPHLDHRVTPPWLKKVIDPLKQEVKRRGLWACHLGLELGGKGFGQVRLSLMNEILAPYQWGPTFFGVQGPDTGNAEVLAHYGIEAQKRLYLEPLLVGEILSAFSMTEPQWGSDPALFECRAERDGDERILTGEKFFTSNAEHASFSIVMAVTNPDGSCHRGMSMFLVPKEAPGITILRPTRYMDGGPEGMDHPHVRYEGVRLPLDAMLSQEGFVLRTAWRIDRGEGYSPEVRRDIAVAKVLSYRVMLSVIEKAVHLNGALGTTDEMPLARLWQLVPAYGIWDGPTEANVSTAARIILRDRVPSSGLWPSEWVPARMEVARRKYAVALAERADAGGSGA